MTGSADPSRPAAPVSRGPGLPRGPWYVYLIRTRSGTLYTGIATDVKRRLKQHGNGQGSKYLRARAPLELVYHARLGSRALALRAEYRIKKLTRSGKESIVTSAPGSEALLARLGIPLQGQVGNRCV